jgi:hypothetical protein
MKNAISFLVSISLLLILVGCGNGVIGEIRGSEWETIMIDDVEYVKATNTSISASDRGDFIGEVTDGENTRFKVYSVKNDTDGKYIYCLWEWEGSVYEKMTD